MALSQSVLSELLDAFRSGEGVDLVRDAVQLVMQELIEVEATEQIGAARYERTDARTTDRNGSRPRLLTTQAGDIELRIPKLRELARLCTWSTNTQSTWRLRSWISSQRVTCRWV